MPLTANRRVTPYALERFYCLAIAAVLFFGYPVGAESRDRSVPGGTIEPKRNAEASPASSTPAPSPVVYTPSPSGTPLQERQRSVFRDLGPVIALLALNLAGWFIFWIWIQRLFEAVKESHDEIERRMRKHDTDYRSLAECFGGLARRMENVERQPDRPIKSEGFPGRSIDHPQPLQPAPPKAFFHPSPSESEALRAPSDAPSASQSAPPPTPLAPPPITRESLGEAFLAEARRSTGEEAPMVWERFFAKVKLMSPRAEYSNVYWDRAAKDVHFKDESPSTYSDTGTCWRLSASNESLLFFRALVSPARQSDLPGCRIVSSDKALLDPAKLIRFTPPTVVQDSYGWRVEAEGDLRYQ